jgi:FkbM family methyltransferase
MKQNGGLLLRRILMPLFSRLNPGDVTITHPWTGDRIRIHSYHHKGYWLLGRWREAETMRLLRRIVPAGGTVLDLGAHIGFLSLYLSSLAGPGGRVFAFEPGPNNLPYLRRNVRSRPNITVVPKGVGNADGETTFYVETLTGQNNSFVRDFDIFEYYRNRAFDSRIRVSEVKVGIVTLDRFVRDEGLRPDLLKIDVEGFEREVLEGASSVLREAKPILEIEISRDKGRVMELLTSAGYALFTPGLRVVRSPEDAEVNTFCFHRERHGALIPGAAR